MRLLSITRTYFPRIYVKTKKDDVEEAVFCMVLTSTNFSWHISITQYQFPNNIVPIKKIRNLLNLGNIEVFCDPSEF